MFFIFSPRGVQTCFDDVADLLVQLLLRVPLERRQRQQRADLREHAVPGFRRPRLPEDCDTGSTRTAMGRPVINVTSHEHNEAITDPEPTSGWFDDNDFSTGGENGDKCAWYFGYPGDERREVQPEDQRPPLLPPARVVELRWGLRRLLRGPGGHEAHPGRGCGRAVGQDHRQDLPAPLSSRSTARRPPASRRAAGR